MIARERSCWHCLRASSFAVLTVASLIGCASVFTPQIRDQLQGSQLDKVQYYLSNTVTMTRVLATGEEPAVKSGRVSLINGKRIETVVILANTPGVLVGVSYGPLSGSGYWEFFAICFESADSDLNKYLVFAKKDSVHKYELVSVGSWPVTRYGDYDYSIGLDGTVTPFLLGYIDSKYIETNQVRSAEGRLVH